jgi:hypothetical protein
MIKMNIELIEHHKGSEFFDEEVYNDGKYLIIFSSRPFSNGYNVYEIFKEEGIARKKNDQMSWFISLEAAKKFISE